MSDLMLHGVLKMPPEFWRDDPIDVAQRHSRYNAASYRIERLTAVCEQALEALQFSVGGEPLPTLELAAVAAIKAALADA